MGRRVVLREPRDDDGPALFRYTSDPEVTRFLAVEQPGSLEETLGFIGTCRAHRSQGREYVFVIADVDTDVAMGIICLRHIDQAMRTAQVGTWLGRDRWGSGANTEAKRLILDFAFDRLRLHRVEARISVDNDRSRRAFERLGATREGLLKESFFKNGRYYDQHLYVVLEQDWRGRQRRSAR